MQFLHFNPPGETLLNVEKASSVRKEERMYLECIREMECLPMLIVVSLILTTHIA
jgi:hypothetical protein